MYSPHALKSFHLQYPDQPGPPAKLPAWLQAFEQEREDYAELAGNKEMSAGNKEMFYAQT